MTLRASLLLLVLTIGCAQIVAQALHRSHPEFSPEPSVQRQSDAILITSNSPRPLVQVLDCLSKEYGWTINYDDPVYGGGDSVDDADAQWHAAHPQAPGPRIPAGGYFQTRVPKLSSMERGSQAESLSLQKVLEDYDQSGNPGKFEVRMKKNGSFDVVGVQAKSSTGTNAPFPSVLDTKVSMPATPRSGFATLDLILHEVSVRSSTKLNWGSGGVNGLVKVVAIGGVDTPARDLLQETIDSMPHKMAWHLLYDADSQAYYFNLRVATKVKLDASGNKVEEYLP